MSPADHGEEVASVSVLAPAKINLWLRVLGRFEDGYHRLDTVFQSLELADRVTVTAASDATLPVALSVVSSPGAAEPVAGVPRGDDNLCVRAARAYLESWPSTASFSIVLEKRIPVSAGLGGGSSDAAAVLLALRALTGTPETLSELTALAGGLGADVPFFLVGGTVRGRGRGDRLEALPDLEPSPVWLVAPRGALSTADVFANHAATRGLAPGSVEPGDEMSLPGGRRIEDWVRGNDLEPAALRLRPEIEAIYTVLQRFGFDSVQLSGSGGVVFGIPPAGVEPEAVARELGEIGELHVTRTLSRREIRPARGP